MSGVRRDPQDKGAWEELYVHLQALGIKEIDSTGAVLDVHPIDFCEDIANRLNLGLSDCETFAKTLVGMTPK